jgi:flavin-dependent dehydrogenase
MDARVAIVGAGPAGALLAYLLSSRGIIAANVLVPAFRGHGDPDEAASRVEGLRGPEIDRIQRIAAMPPRLVMGQTVLHEAIRRGVALLAASRATLPVARRGAAIFLDGVSNVRLTV